jgi:fructose 5-dehydrogenase cytochrome subunit
LFRYLKFGKVAGKAHAGGEMALAVQLSFSRLSDEDLHAMVSYLRSVPPLPDPHAKSKFMQGGPFSDVASFRGVGGMSYDRSLPDGTAQLFAANCATCHGVAAQGSRDTYFPSLFHNSALATGGGRNVIATILFGISCSTTDGPHVYAWLRRQDDRHRRFER